MGEDILQNDVDSGHNTDEVNKAVESDITTSEAVVPKDGVSTSSFKVAAAQFAVAVLSLIVTFAVGAKWIGADVGDNLRQTLTQGLSLVTILFGSGASVMGAVYIHGRNKVAQIKASAAADIVRAKANAFSHGGVIGEVATTTLEPQQGFALHSVPLGGPLGGFGLDPMAMATMGLNMALMFLGNATTGKKAKVVKALRAAQAALAEYQSDN